jgi:YHS domain-containing protein
MNFNVLIVFLLVITITQSQAQTDAWRLKEFNLKKNLALEGYDPVSYFEGKPEEGNEDIKYLYKEITYYFISKANLDKFKTNPGKYEPAYGGWCAYAMGQTGEKVKVDPETFKILNGKLYLFYNFWGNNTLEDWNERELKLKEAADRNWAKIRQ